ncbi:MAG: hypothetical protein WC785_01025 [Tatlockia sp.]|jgi:hypothetical protein
MKKPTFTKKKAGQDNAAEYNPNRKHLQSVVVRGNACQYIRTYDPNLKIHAPIESDTEILGVGAYFPPLVEKEIDCRCLGLWDDIPDTQKPNHEVGDLKPIVEFFRLKGRFNEKD